MPNASNTIRVEKALADGPTSPAIADVTATRAVLAVQGPRARERLATVAPEAAAVGRFRVAETEIAGHRVVVAGTGYTGEDGVEIAVPVDAAIAVWDLVRSAGITPAGLGARDTLRLEASLPLHGHERGPGQVVGAGGQRVGTRRGEHELHLCLGLARLSDEGGRIVDEYGAELTPAEMLARITNRECANRGGFPYWYASHEEAMRRNHAKLGPRGLWRHDGSSRRTVNRDPG